MIKDKILNDLKSCMTNQKLSFSDKFVVEIPNNPLHGDYSTNIAMVSAKLNKIPPIELAKKITEQLSKKTDYSNIEIAGPGFINFKVSDQVLREELKNIYAAGYNYGKSNFGEGRKVLLEFVSANPTGPLNIVSARAAAYGDTLYRIMNHVGYEAKREFYVNDAGNQVDILAESIELRYRELLGENIGDFPVEAYHGEYISEMAMTLRTFEGTKLIHMAEKDRLDKIKMFAIEEINRIQMESLDKFDVEFDNWFSEKVLREEGIVEEVLSYLAEADCTFEKDEAVWFCSSKFGDEKDRVLMRSDGTITYIVPDIAYHLTKYQRGYDIMLDVLGPDHHGYVPRLRAAIRALKYDESKLEIVFLQQVNLFEQGEKVKMSKRAGKIITMDELIEDVGKDAARYFFIDRKPSAHLNFDLELAKSTSSDNPVYYCQYAHARICSIFKKAEENKIILKENSVNLLDKLKTEEEMAIIKKLIHFPDILNDSADTREPHRLASYIHELAGMFHKYYTKYPIVSKKASELTQARLYLLKSVQNIIRLGLYLMGIHAPIEMTKAEKKEKKGKTIVVAYRASLTSDAEEMTKIKKSEKARPASLSNFDYSEDFSEDDNDESGEKASKKKSKKAGKEVPVNSGIEENSQKTEKLPKGKSTEKNTKQDTAKTADSVSKKEETSVNKQKSNVKKETTKKGSQTKAAQTKKNTKASRPAKTIDAPRRLKRKKDVNK